MEPSVNGPDFDEPLFGVVKEGVAVRAGVIVMRVRLQFGLVSQIIIRAGARFKGKEKGCGKDVNSVRIDPPGGKKSGHR